METNVGGLNRGMGNAETNAGGLNGRMGNTEEGKIGRIDKSIKTLLIKI